MSMHGKYFLMDATRCTACRGCQAACKQWNRLPAVRVHQWGSYQNPVDLGPYDWRLVRFSESEDQAMGLQWLFFSDSCRHCLDPYCKQAADEYVPGAVVIDDATGAVIFTEKSRRLGVAFRDVRDACPYGVPNRANPGERLLKCTMCLDRLHAGMPPACAASCPTGALRFGDGEEIAALAQQRLAMAKPRHPSAHLVGSDDTRVWYLLVRDPAAYGARG